MNWQELLRQVWEHIAYLGDWGPFAFIPVHMACTLVFIPTAALSVAGGALFGVLAGSAAVFTASFCSAALVFLLGRYCSRGWLLQKIGKSPRLQALDEAVGAQGKKLVLLLRLSALFPYTFLNYGLGLTKISAKDYLTASAIGMLPGTVVYVYLGSIARDAMAEDAAVRPLEWALMGVGLVSTVIIGTWATRLVRKTLKSA